MGPPPEKPTIQPWVERGFGCGCRETHCQSVVGDVAAECVTPSSRSDVLTLLIGCT